MEDGRVQRKLELLFEKLAQPNYVLDNYYSDGLINKLSESNSDPDISFLEGLPFVADSFIEAVDRTTKLNTHISVKVFLTRLLALGCRKELYFTRFICKQSDKILCELKNINSPDMNPSLRVAFMEVALAMANHNSGTSWLLETGIWKEILSLGNEKTTVFVVRQTYKFVAEFLWRLNDMRRVEDIKDVLSFIIKPIIEDNYLDLESFTSDEEEVKCKYLEPILHMIIATLSKDNRIHQSSILVNVIVNDLRIVSHLYIVGDRIHKSDTSLLLSRVTFWLLLSKILLNKPMKPDVEYVPDDFLELGVTYFNIIQFYVQRRNATAVLDFCSDCAVIWKSVFGDQIIIADDNSRKINFKTQMLFMCLVPLLIFIKYGKCVSAVTNDNIHEYIMKLLNSSCEHTTKAAYTLRDLIFDLDTMPLILRGVKKLTYLKHHLNDEQANLVFQALFYALREYDPIDDYGEVKQENNFEDTQENVFVMTYVLDIVLSLVKNHNINWHESLEVLCLYSVVFNILKRTNLTCKFIVTALNLIAVTVKKFLPPNLSLLLESKPGSTMHELGKLIYMKMHDLHWEIRDSALELLLVCTEISYVKFTPFQKQIMENNLINVAATIAFNDFESYVQVSALKCLGAASKIGNMWDQLKTQYPNIQDQIVSILRDNQEGIVRKEACNVLCDIYQNIKLTPQFKQMLYEHMVSAALADFHWEVQLSALKFWKIVYQSLLTDQGMLDGVFPPVTFSRESRKIVTLNAAEIQRRLLKVLDELTSIGCLTVLVKLLHDDTEPEIMECALGISKELLDILQRYKVPECIKPVPGEPATVEELLLQVKEEHDAWNTEEMTDMTEAPSSENVIEGILNADDINLLASIYEQHMTLRTEPPVGPSKPRIKLLRYVSPYLFVNYLKSVDFKAVVEQKREWSEGIRSVSSLLDDILGIYEVREDVNSLDCY